MFFKVLLFLLIGLTCLSLYAATEEEVTRMKCFDEEHCKCTENRVECKCTNGGSLTMIPFLKYLAEVVTVDGCNRVEVSIGSLSGSFLEKASFTNINNLVIKSFGIAGRSFSTKKVDSIIRFENISSLFIESFGITALHKVRVFIMKNVTIEKLDSFAITGIDMTHFVIVNSTLLYLDTLALHLTNVLDFTVMNSNIVYAANLSFVIKDSHNVFFENCYFHYSASDSIFLAYINSVNILNCTFESLPATIFWARGRTFRFHRNIVRRYSEENAFQMVLSNRIEFTDNSFRSVALNSILPNPNANISAEDTIFNIDGNSFYCECPISWIFNDSTFYSRVIESSFCSNLPQLKLKQLVSFFERKDMCLHPVHDNVNHDMLHIFPFAMDKIKSKRLRSNTSAIVPLNALTFILLFLTYLHKYYDS
ncbi:uncharacterized protein [Parasteatoda tepidariorum]|uniref:uncharacterized protein n=1 Tax=Parasteatoda tepidariorum TaxID=114398 RepID=UPI00077FDD7E|nr:uncharacterized protein LOC107451046 [Parasteatoda tepidariorum]